MTNLGTKVGAWLAGDWPLPGGDPAHFQWGMASFSRYPEVQVLRQLVKAAEQAETELEGLRTRDIGVHVAVLFRGARGNRL